MDIKEYEIKGKHKDTGHKRTIRAHTVTPEHCKSIAAEKGLLEPYEITELPPEMPTERQLKYATDLSISIPVGATSNDISNLISRKENNDGQDPNPGLIDYANARELPFSKYIGKKALYNLVFDSLSSKDKIAFFVFCVYRWLSDDRDGNLDIHKYKDKIYEIAENLSNDDKFIKSMNRYTGENIRYFGEIRSGNGEVYTGGSIQTYAYKTVAEILCKEFNLSNRTFKVLHDNKVCENSKPKGMGCLSATLFFIIIFVSVLSIFNL